jgi:hypothetical protein
MEDYLIQAQELRFRGLIHGGFIGPAMSSCLYGRIRPGSNRQVVTGCRKASFALEKGRTIFFFLLGFLAESRRTRKEFKSSLIETTTDKVRIAAGPKVYRTLRFLPTSKPDDYRSVKILVIMGSPRKGNTWKAAHRIEENMLSYGSFEFEYLMLKDADFAHCTGSFICFLWGEGTLPEPGRCPGDREVDA